MLDEASKQRVKELCELIAKEQDHNRFSQLISELNHLLDGYDSRPGLPPGGPTPGSEDKSS